MTTSCPACGSPDLHTFHMQHGVPTNSCLLLPTAEEARSYPRGDLTLAVCAACGFIHNRTFDPSLAQYSAAYEETQSFSPKFRSFATGLASAWVEKYGLQGKHVLEIGCGKGEFLVEMIRAGAGHGTGIDPGVHPERIDPSLDARLTWIADFYDDRYAGLEADAIVCRHTLEHIAPVGDFLRSVRRALGDRLDTPILFELPDVIRVLDEVAFWDVYYEHCSYFSAGSLVRLFRDCGFDVLDVSLAYDDQYLLLEALPAGGTASTTSLQLEDDLGRLLKSAQAFGESFAAQISGWRATLEELHAGGGHAAIWGAGSKGVAFLSALGDLVEVAVDINPHKRGMYMAGAGHRIVAPEDLREQEPALVVAMNPIYLPEIQADLDRLGIATDLRGV